MADFEKHSICSRQNLTSFSTVVRNMPGKSHRTRHDFFNTTHRHRNMIFQCESEQTPEDSSGCILELSVDFQSPLTGLSLKWKLRERDQRVSRSISGND